MLFIYILGGGNLEGNQGFKVPPPINLRNRKLGERKGKREKRQRPRGGGGD